MRRARSIWCMTSSYSKTCVFVRPHVNEKPNICALRAFLKKMRFRWLFSPDRTVDQTGGEKKKKTVQTRMDTCERDLYYVPLKWDQCSAVPGSQAVETSREQVKQKQSWHCSAVRRSLFQAFRLREWREKMWAGKMVRGWGRGCFPAFWYFCAVLRYMNACNSLSQADLRFFYPWMITHSSLPVTASAWSRRSFR